MDERRFDDLAKNLAGRLPRRTVLRALGAAVVGLLTVGRSAPEGASATRTCSGTGGACDADRDCCQPAICAGGHCCPAGRVFCKGQCVPGCAASDQCHAAGVLDPDTCQCANLPKPNGSPCDDGDPCTVSDACQNGICRGSPKDCSALTQGCLVGVCQVGTGQCVQQATPDDTPCNDGNLCTQTDVCIQGVCVGRNHVVCPGATNQCKTQGTCDPMTGLCNKGGNVADGTPCNDADPCTRVSTCQGGQCIGSDYVLTCAKGHICIKDVNGQFICARKNDVKAIDLHP